MLVHMTSSIFRNFPYLHKRIKMIVIPDNIRGLIFDLDGTLADTMPIHLESWVLTGKDFEVEITSELIHQYAGTPTIKLVEKFNNLFGWELDAKEVRKAKTKHFNAIKARQGKIMPIEKIFEIAKDMRSQLPMCIGTGSSRANAHASLEDLAATDWWVKVITSSDDIKGKPSPDIFLACASAMNIPPRNCLVFEDGKAGIAAAKAAGMPYIDITKHI